MREYRIFLRLIALYYSEHSCVVIKQALRCASVALKGMKRYNGDPFLFHSLRTAYIVVEELGLGRNSVVAALLHDVSRLGLIPEKELEERFGTGCMAILRGLNNISQVDPKTSSLQVDNFRELIVSYSTDPRVILIKMADRLEVMRSLADFPELKRNKKSWETIHLYAQLAHKLGLYNIKSELEDLSLRYLESREYRSIETKLAESKSEREQFIAQFVAPVEAKLKQLGVDYKLKSRTKSIYSIWRKMKKQKVTFEEVYDVFAIRIIIDCPIEIEKMQCWTVFSVVTDFYTPNPERMRDWISIPKSNGYESLHATVVTGQGRWVEVQIRTHRMDEVAERGVAAHWRYKGVSGSGISSEEWLARLRGVVETASSIDEISEEFDISKSMNEVFVFTPNGDLRKLPEGATVLDFAFDIHSNLGMNCTGGRIGGRNVPIKELLHSGDVVEVLTSKNQRPSAGWLSIVVTGKAKSKIKQILREEKAYSTNLGREELERKLKNWKIQFSIEEAVTILTKHYKVKTGVEVYGLIAEQKVAMAEVKNHLLRVISGNLPVVESKPRKATSSKVTKDDGALVIDDTLRKVEYKLAKCCNPIFGDEVFGFVTIQGGITIHRVDCPNATRLRDHYPYRMLPARWKSEIGSGGAFRATIRIHGEDLPGMATRITDLIGRDLKINIRSMSFNSSGGSIDSLLSIEVNNTVAVDMVLHNVKKLKGVTRAYRVN